MHVHLVFVTKYRRGVLDDAMLTRCEEVMREVCADFGAELVEFTGEHDHVHLLVEHPPKVAVSVLVNSLNGVSRPVLVAQLLRRVLRWGTAPHHPAIRRATEGARLGMRLTPAVRSRTRSAGQ